MILGRKEIDKWDKLALKSLREDEARKLIEAVKVLSEGLEEIANRDKKSGDLIYKTWRAKQILTKVWGKE